MRTAADLLADLRDATGKYDAEHGLDPARRGGPGFERRTPGRHTGRGCRTAECTACEAIGEQIVDRRRRGDDL